MEALRSVEESDAYKAYREEHPDAYLVHAFTMVERGRWQPWQFGYYAKGTGKIVVFKTEPVERLPEDEPLREEGHVAPLDMEAVQVAPEQAVAEAEAHVNEHYEGEQVNKVILILQDLGQPLYNLTLVTAQFNFINLRLDAATGEVLHAERKSIMSLGT